MYRRVPSYLSPCANDGICPFSFMVTQLAIILFFYLKLASGFVPGCMSGIAKPSTVATATKTKSSLSFQRTTVGLSVLTTYESSLKATSSEHGKGSFDDGRRLFMTERIKKVHTVTVCVVPPPDSVQTWEIIQKFRAELKDPGFYR